MLLGCVEHLAINTVLHTSGEKKNNQILLGMHGLSLGGMLLSCLFGFFDCRSEWERRVSAIFK